MKTTRTVYENKNTEEFFRALFRALRERTPIEFWPNLLLDPRNTAHKTVFFSKKKPLYVEYTGQFGDPIPRQLANFEGKIASPENAVYIYKDASIIGRYPVGEVNGKYLVPSWFGVDSAFFIHQNKYLKRSLPLKRVIQSNILEPEPTRNLRSAFLLSDERGATRYGWFHEILPKLLWFEEYRDITKESPRLILHSPIEKYQKKCLNYLGYNSESWIEHGKETTQVDRLIVAPHPLRLEGNPSSGFASQLQWVGKRIISNLPETNDSFSNRIYISRADANRRHVQNEEEVRNILEGLGFEWYEPGRLSFEDQARLFAGANIIVGLHGLAYINLMFATEDTNLVEIFPQDGCDESYFVVANELDISYECLVFDPVNNDDNRRPINKDIRIDTNRLKRVVENIIEHDRES